MTMSRFNTLLSGKRRKGGKVSRDEIERIIRENEELLKACEEEEEEDEDDEEDEESESIFRSVYFPMTLLVVIAALAAFIVAKNLDWGARRSYKADSGQEMFTTTAAAGGQKLELDTRAMQQDSDVQEEVTSRNVFFAGIEDSVLYGEGRIALDNLPENEDFLMRYEVYDTESDERVFETGLIPSGERVYFDPYSVLEPGIYHLMFQAVPYLERNGEYLALTSGSNEVTIELKNGEGKEAAKKGKE